MWLCAVATVPGLHLLTVLWGSGASLPTSPWLQTARQSQGPQLTVRGACHSTGRADRNCRMGTPLFGACLLPPGSLPGIQETKEKSGRNPLPEVWQPHPCLVAGLPPLSWPCQGSSALLPWGRPAHREGQAGPLRVPGSRPTCAVLFRAPLLPPHSADQGSAPTPAGACLPASHLLWPQSLLGLAPWVTVFY